MVNGEWYEYVVPLLHRALAYVGGGEIGTLFGNCHQIGQIGDIHLLLLEDGEERMQEMHLRLRLHNDHDITVMHEGRQHVNHFVLLSCPESREQLVVLRRIRRVR